MRHPLLPQEKQTLPRRIWWGLALLCLDRFALTLTAGLPPPFLSNVPPSFCRARRWGLPGCCPSLGSIPVASQRKAEGLWIWAPSNQRSHPRDGGLDERGLQPSEALLLQIQWALCREGEEMVSIPVCISLRNISWLPAP